MTHPYLTRGIGIGEGGSTLQRRGSFPDGEIALANPVPSRFSNRNAFITNGQTHQSGRVTEPCATAAQEGQTGRDKLAFSKGFVHHIRTDRITS